jgi:type I restriction enzyme S subunit
MGQFSKVASSNLNAARLDAEYYGTAYVKNAERIASFGNVSTLEEMRKRTVPIRRGIDMPNFVDDETSPLMVTIAAFDDPGINFKGLQRVSTSQHQAFKGSHIKAGDLLVAMGGYAGKAAICPLDIPESNIGRHTARIVVDETKADVYYVWAFIRSTVGTLQFNRYITGSVQAGINLEDIRDIAIASPTGLVQKYVGDKVRQAERQRAWAKLVETYVNQYHQTLVPQQIGLDFAKRVRVVSPARMSERLDAHFYPGVVDEYLRLHQGTFKPLGKLCATIYNGQTQPETGLSSSCKQITVTNLSSSFLGGIPRDVEAPGKKEKFLNAYDILMCNAAHNKSYIGKDLTFVHSEAAILPSTEVMTIRVDRNQVPASYIRAYLLTKLGYVQIQSTIRGITAHSYPDDVALLDI